MTRLQQDETSQYWFPARRYGWGWGLPSAWQGWCTLILYFVAIALSARRFPPEAESTAFVSSAVLLTALLVIVCWKKGEPTRWRWGK